MGEGALIDEDQGGVPAGGILRYLDLGTEFDAGAEGVLAGGIGDDEV